MVSTKKSAWVYLLLFLLPALIVYGIFFVTPFLQGIGISFTNWDGLTPRIPNSMPQARFEQEILNQVDQGDRIYLETIYRLEDGVYLHSGFNFWDRGRIEGILDGIDWHPENNRFVGLDNYTDLFTDESKTRGFYPEDFTQYHFKETQELAAFILPPDIYHGVLMVNSSDEEKELMEKVFQWQERREAFQVIPEYQETRYRLSGVSGSLPVRSIPDIMDISSGEVREIGNILSQMGWDDQRANIPEYLQSLAIWGTLDLQQQEEFLEVGDKLGEIGGIKRILFANLQEQKFKLGVLGFTAFFTVLNVILTNVVAFMLALALDRHIRSRNALRGVFFLPNVLSLVIVAFTWNLVFDYLMGPMMGIDKWMSDPDKAPWLVVFVSVWQGAGYLMVIYLAGLQSIPGEVLEAASVDGAGGLKKLMGIIIPLLMPAITICLFLSISNSLKSFDLIYIMSGGPSARTSGTVHYVMDIYFEAYSNKQAGLASAKAVMLMLVILVVTGFQLSVMKKREVEY